MNLTKKDFIKICDEFNLGSLKDSNFIEEGLDNFNYQIKTTKSIFIIRVVRKNKSKNQLQNLKQEFKLLNYLNHNFDYRIPVFIKTKKGKTLYSIKGNILWVYERLEGTSLKRRPNFNEMKEIAKALANYHKKVKGFGGNKNEIINYYSHIYESFKKLDKIKPKTKEDKFVIKYANLFKGIPEKFIKENFSKNLLMLHSDFDGSNVLFENGKITGIIDFDDSVMGPRIRDVAISIKDSCCPKGKLNRKWLKEFMREYEKINPLTKEEKDMIIPFILLENASFLIWAYLEMEKVRDKRIKYMKEVVKLTKSIVR
jgi:Ser/Thr protein kinase RdoA (MazF antagonist)